MLAASNRSVFVRPEHLAALKQIARISGCCSQSQVIDSLSVKMTTIPRRLNSDSNQQNLAQLPDTLPRPLHRLDSMRSEFTVEAERMRQKYLHAMAELEINAKIINVAIDSLQKLDLRTQKYTSKRDSLQQLRNNFESKYKSISVSQVWDRCRGQSPAGNLHSRGARCSADRCTSNWILSYHK